MYVSNQVRQRRYLKGRRDEEENAINQQEVLDGLISKELGLDNTADYLNNVNRRIAERIKKEMAFKNAKDSSSENILSEQAKMNKEDFDVNTLTDYIKNGALSNLLDEFKKIDPKMLSKKAKIVQKDLSNNELKEVFNDEISIILSDNSIPDSKKPNMIKKIVYDILAGGDKSIIDELLKKSRYTQGVKDKDKFIAKDKDNFIAKELQKEYKDMYLTAKMQEKIVDRNVNKMKLQKKADFDKNMREKMAELRAKKNTEIEKNNISNIKDFDKNMREKMAELRAKKNASSLTNTSVMSDAPQSLDLRTNNTGRPKLDTNLDFEKYIVLLEKYNKSKGSERTKINNRLRAIQNRQPNEKIKERMEEFRKALLR